MTLILVVLAVATVGVTTAYVMMSGSAVHGVLAGENTAVGLRDAAAETVGETRSPVRSDWQLATVTDLTNAEELLDALEARGFTERELVVLGNHSFLVRWR